MNGNTKLMGAVSWLSFFDWVVVALVFASTLFSVWYGKRWASRRSQQTMEDYLLMGRMLSLPLFVATLVATWYGSIFAVTQLTYEQGIYCYVSQGIFWYLTYFVAATFLVDRIWQTSALSLPDLIGSLAGPKSSKVASIFAFFDVLPIVYIMGLIYFLRILLGHDNEYVALGCIGIVIAYSVYGGFSAVVFSDIVQFFIMLISVAAVILFSYLQFGGSDYLTANLPETHWSPLGKESFSRALVWVFIAFSTLIDPGFYQRILAAKSPKVAKRGIYISILIWIAFDCCTTLGGLYARAALPEAQSYRAYMEYSLMVLPTGFKGLFLGGILATTLSTLDSYLFLSGTFFTYGVMPKQFRTKISLHRVGVVIVGLTSSYVAFSYKGPIIEFLKICGSYSAACLLFPTLWLIFMPQKITDFGFFATVTGSAATMAIGQYFFDVDPFYLGLATAFMILSINQITYTVETPNCDLLEEQADQQHCA